jgi:predicted RNA binding protein YcfA (HicA-like mRNA interferase family)
VSRLPVVNFRKLNSLLLKLGFEAVRQKGSHVFYRHNDGRTTIVPHHKGKDLPRPLVRDILRDIELTPDEFREALDDL